MCNSISVRILNTSITNVVFIRRQKRLANPGVHKVNFEVSPQKSAECSYSTGAVVRFLHRTVHVHELLERASKIERLKTNT